MVAHPYTPSPSVFLSLSPSLQPTILLICVSTKKQCLRTPKMSRHFTSFPSFSRITAHLNFTLTLSWSWYYYVPTASFVNIIILCVGLQVRENDDHGQWVHPGSMGAANHFTVYYRRICWCISLPPSFEPAWQSQCQISMNYAALKSTNSIQCFRYGMGDRSVCK